MRGLNIVKYSNILKRSYCTPKLTPTPSTTSVKSKVSPSTDAVINFSKATGLSSKCLATAEPVGPGAAKTAEYKVPEYFNYNRMSYFEAEVEMLKFRCPQPSAIKK